MPIDSISTTDLSPRPLGSQTQVFFAVKSIHAFGVDVPAFSLEKDVQTTVAVPHTYRRQLFQPQAQRRLLILGRLVTVSRATAAPICKLAVH